MRTRLSLLGAACLLAAGCISEARMRLPVGLDATTDRIELAGMGGWRSGSFRLGASTGTFERRADRLGIFDPLLVRQYGGAQFTVAGPNFAGTLTGRCSFSQGSVNVGPLTGRMEPLVYRCEFDRDGRPSGFLELRDRDGFLGSPDGRDARVGFAEIEGVRIGLRSIHLTSASPIPLATPLGYVLEQNGREIGAVDLNGPDKTLHVPRDSATRQAVLAAAMALSLFWDPAEVGADL